MTQSWEEWLISHPDAATQRDLNRLEKWADRNLGNFSKEKCKVPHLARNNPIHQ